MTAKAANFLMPRLLRAKVFDIQSWLDQEEVEEVAKSPVLLQDFSRQVRYYFPSRLNSKLIRRGQLKIPQMSSWPGVLRVRLKTMKETPADLDTTGLTPLQSIYLRLQRHLRVTLAAASLINCEIAAFHLAWLAEVRDSNY